MLDDPKSAPIYRVSGKPPFPSPTSALPQGIKPRHVTLRDRVTTATIIPYASADEVPLSLMSYLNEQFNKLIEEGDTYPVIDPQPLEAYGPYWFSSFGAVMLLGDIKDAAEVRKMADEGLVDWNKTALGNFYIRSNCNSTLRP